MPVPAPSALEDSPLLELNAKEEPDVLGSGMDKDDHNCEHLIRRLARHYVPAGAPVLEILGDGAEALTPV